MITKLQGSKTWFSDGQNCTPISCLHKNLLKMTTVQMISPESRASGH